MSTLTFARDENEYAPFAVSVTNGKVTYLWPSGSDPWLDADRVTRLAEFTGAAPKDDDQWLQLAVTHVGDNLHFDPPFGEKEMNTKDAQQYLDAQSPPAPVRSPVINNASDNFDQISADYPGFAEDPDDLDDSALTNLVLMNLGPIDPDGPNGWVLRAQDGDPAPGDENAYLHWPGTSDEVESTDEEATT